MSITYTLGTEGGGVSSPESDSLSSKSSKAEKFALIEGNYRAPVAHLVVHRAVTREVVSSRLRPDQHSGSLKITEEKVLPL